MCEVKLVHGIGTCMGQQVNFSGGQALLSRNCIQEENLRQA